MTIYLAITRTIQKVPLAKAQTALGKQEIHSVEQRYLSHCWNSAKNCFASVMAKKRLSIWQLSTALNTKKNHIWSHDYHCVLNLLLCTKFHQNETIFRWQFTDFKDGGWPPFLIIKIWSLCYITSIAMLFCIPMQNFTEIWKSASEL